MASNGSTNENNEQSTLEPLIASLKTCVAVPQSTFNRMYMLAIDRFKTEKVYELRLLSPNAELSKNSEYAVVIAKNEKQPYNVRIFDQKKRFTDYSDIPDTLAELIDKKYNDSGSIHDHALAEKITSVLGHTCKNLDSELENRLHYMLNRMLPLRGRTFLGPRPLNKDALNYTLFLLGLSLNIKPIHRNIDKQPKPKEIDWIRLQKVVPPVGKQWLERANIWKSIEAYLTTADDPIIKKLLSIKPITTTSTVSNVTKRTTYPTISQVTDIFLEWLTNELNGRACSVDYTVMSNGDIALEFPGALHQFDQLTHYSWNAVRRGLSRLPDFQKDASNNCILNDKSGHGPYDRYIVLKRSKRIELVLQNTQKASCPA